MHKLKLDLDSLNVQSFAPAPWQATERGTVRGHWTAKCTLECPSEYNPECPSAYNEAGTCQVTDLNTCQATCGSTCAYTCDDPYSCVTCNGVQCEEPY